MKKICLSLVLSVVSVFSTSAQTNQQTAPNAALTDVKPAAVASSDKPSETDIPAEKKPAPTTAEVKTAPVNAPVKVVVTTTEIVKNAENVKTTEPTRARAAESEDGQGLSDLLMKKPTLEGLSTGSAEIDGYIEEFCALYNVDPFLIYAQMSQESSFKGRATSAKGASGFMQLMPDTARRFGVTNIYNPKQNIKAGVKYMRWLLDKFGGDTRLALAGYNAGEGAVVKHGNKVPPYRETQNYVARIMTHYDLISSQGLTVAKTDD